MFNPFSAWAHGGDTSAYGVLPSLSEPTPDFLPFYFTSLNTTILNCTLTGPNGLPHLYIVTDPSLPGYTVFKTVDSRNVALIEWSHSSAQVEIHDTLPKQVASQFLTLSHDQRFHIMTVAQQEFAWDPRDNMIYMYRLGVNSSSTSHWAKLSKEGGLMTLELSPSVLESRLLYPVVMGVVLLQGGRHIN